MVFVVCTYGFTAAIFADLASFDAFTQALLLLC